jgi:hypothetical protein
MVVWEEILQGKRTQQRLQLGKIIKSFADTLNKVIVDDLVYRLDFEGMNTLALNHRDSSIIFDSVDIPEIDMYLVYSFIGNLQIYRHTVYQAEPAINVAPIAQKYGGNGHEGAAGFLQQHLPFTQGKNKTRNINTAYDNPYRDIHKMITSSSDTTILAKYLFSENNRKIRTNQFNGWFEDIPAMIVNHYWPFTEDYLPFIDITIHQLIVSFVWTNFGQYRVVLHPVVPQVITPAMIDKYKMHKVDGAYWFYCERLPFGVSV